MSKALSVDLRVRVVAAVLSGATHRQAAETVWRQRGKCQPLAARWFKSGAMHGLVRWAATARSGPIEAQAGLIQTLLDETPDISIEKLRRALGARGHWFGYGTVHRFFRRHRITRKKRRPTPQNKIAPTS